LQAPLGVCSAKCRH